LSTKTSEPSGIPVTHRAAPPSRALRRWQPWALAAICVVAAVLYAWDIAGGQVGNSYYSAAVKSMSSSVTNFLFGSFDAYGVFTVDKPPMSLWPQVVSVWLFGFHGWAVLLPQVVEGVAAVVLLHATVRRWAGENVALLAAVILALTPITVAINRDNNPDTLLVLLLVAASYALTRSLQADQGGPRTRWLLWCAFFIGCGFVTKMLQAWIVVPGFAAAYLVGSAAPVRRRILDVLAAAGVLIASSLWWVALVDLWPGEKPYIGGSEDGSALDLLLGYNGFGRVFGEGQGMPGGGGMPNGADLPAGVDLPSGGFGGGFGGGTGIGRMFGDAVGGQIGWLLPLALLVLVVLSVLGIRATVRKAPVDRVSRAGWVMWGSWLVVTGLVFSYAQGIWHEYYTTMLAPPIAAIVAAGLARFWRFYRTKEGLGWVLLPLGLAMTGYWAFVLASRDTSYFGWVRWIVLAITSVAVTGLVLARLASAGTAPDGASARPVLARGMTVAGLVAVLLTPGVWSVATATDGEENGNIPTAGPGMSGFAGGGQRGGFPGMGQLPGAPNAGGQGGTQQPPAGMPAMPSGGGGFGGGPMGGDSAELTAGQRKILDYAREHGDGAAITLAVDGNAMAAAPYIMGGADGDVVIGMGGFGGMDNSPSVDQLRTWVAGGTLRFVVNGGMFGGGPAGGTQGGGAMPGGAMPGGGAAMQDRTSWIEEHCSEVDPSRYGGDTDSGTTLRECRA